MIYFLFSVSIYVSAGVGDWCDREKQLYSRWKKLISIFINTSKVVVPDKMKACDCVKYGTYTVIMCMVLQALFTCEDNVNIAQ